MIKNYFITTIRNIKRNSFFSIINSFGLAVGIAVSIFIVSWIVDEISYDRFHENADRIFRIERNFNFQDLVREIPVTSGPYAQKLIEEFPEIINATRIYREESNFKDNQNIYRKETTFFVDGAFLDIFSFKLLKGQKTALQEPNSVVLTEKVAAKYFGDNSAYGKMLKMDFGDQEYELKVTGILEEIPSYSHFHPEMLVSLNSLSEFKVYFEDWRENFMYTYILVENPNDNETLLAGFPDFLTSNVEATYKNLIEEGKGINDIFQLKLKRITDIHLRSSLEFELEDNGDISLVLLFAAVAFLILLIASINFINLTTAKAETRSLEVGIRKASGAHKKQLIIQFIFESIFIAIISFFIALVLVELLSTYYNNLTGKVFHWIFFKDLNYFILLVLIVLTTGLLSGVYPAFFLSRYKPIEVLKSGKKSGNNKFSLRTVLVVFQFFISVSFIIFSILIYYQIRFIQQKDIGYNKENLIVIPVDNASVRNDYDFIKDELLYRTPYFESISGASILTDSHMYETARLQKHGEDEPHFIIFFDVNYDFMKTMEIELLAGRFFSEEYTDTAHYRFVLNEAAIKNMSYENPKEVIGEKIVFLNNTGGEETGEVIGIVKDFHFKSLHMKVEPLLILLTPQKMSYFYLRIKDGKEQEAISEISRIWQTRFPESELNYHFLSDNLKNQYASERRLQDKLLMATILTIFIASLGLFGLSIFISRQRAKEIGIRKVMGASLISIIKLIGVSYVKWISLSTILAWPVSYFFINNWLQDFSVKIDIIQYWWVFLLSGIFVSIFSLLVVLWQTLKFASINPAESLKYE